MSAALPPPRDPQRGRPPVLVSLVKLLAVLVVAGVLAAVALAPLVGGIGWAANDATDQFLNTSCSVTTFSVPQPTTVYANDGKTVIARLFNQNRKDIALDQVPLPVRQALISTEDRRFYVHHGVDMRGLLRAAVNNTSSSDTQGGSTLTMQYVKQLRYYQADTDAERQAAIAQDSHRKIKDAKCAIDIEKRLSKDQILQDYLNIAFFGENSYGIEVAAETYFNVSANQLTVPQGALLIGLLQSPTAYDPFQHPQVALTRRNEVLQNMVDTGALTAAQGAQDAKQPIQLATTKPPAVAEGCAFANPAIVNAGFFCDYAVDWLERNAGLGQSKLENGGYSVVTTLDPALQTNGQNAVFARGLQATSPTALVMPSVDPRSGAVTSMITSRQYGSNTAAGQTEVPLFTQGYAGAGSTYKLFTTLAAMEYGMQPDYTLTTGNSYTVKNCPYDPHDTTYKPYTVQNAGTYSPTLPLSKALPESVNTFFVGVEDQFFGCTLDPVVQMALRLGMNWLNQPAPGESNKSIAQATMTEHQTGFTLGFAQTSALELTGAYSAVANGGVFCPPHPIASVTDAAGKPVSFKQPQCSQVIAPQIAHTLVNIMTADTRSSYGTAGSYFGSWYGHGGSLVAAKTGTDNDNNQSESGGNSALWFVGMTPTLTSAAALVNPTHPKATLSGLPAGAHGSFDTFGAFSSTFWQAAYAPTLLATPWTWPAANQVDNGVAVPTVLNLLPNDASAALTAAGFKPVVAPIPCGSATPPGRVAYFGPRIAAPGSTVTVCLSNGIPPPLVATPSPTRRAPSRTMAPTRSTTPAPQQPSTPVAPPSRPVVPPSRPVVPSAASGAPVASVGPVGPR